MAKRIQDVSKLRAPRKIQAKPMKVRPRPQPGQKVGISGKTMDELMRDDDHRRGTE